MIISSLLAVFFNLFNPELPKADKMPVLQWHEASIFQLPTQGDTTVEKIVANYLQGLASQGLDVNQQGVWIQSDLAQLASNQGKIPAPAASLTKIATTLASIHTWDLNHQFLTKIYTSGEVQNGILNGDLIIEGNGDPLFVWEEAIAIGNRLNELGITKIQGNLIVVGDFTMNFKGDRQISAQLFKQALNSQKWTPIIEKQYQSIAPLPARPQIEIQGNIVFQEQIPTESKLMITHKSLTLVEILKLMNVYSNNEIAESLGEKIGGGPQIAKMVSELAKVPLTEIKLINGSGLGVDNRISPRAACKMLIALEQKLKGTNINIADLFPVSGIDKKGTIEGRNIPLGVPVKTGTLATVSALAGVISTQERGEVWFAIINYGNGLDNLRKKQDILLQNLDKHWQLKFVIPISENNSYFGDPNRNLI